MHDLEPEIAKTLDRVHAARQSGPYAVCRVEELREVDPLDGPVDDQAECVNSSRFRTLD